jgi:hypothetical protein
MNSKVIYFNDALPIAAKAIHDAGVDAGKVLIVRDLYGRIRVAFDGVPDPHHDVLRAALAALGAFGVSQDQILLYRADFFDPDAVFNDPGILNVQVPGYDSPFRLLDRQIVGQDWLMPHEPGVIPRLVFYGFKGGVGRTTAVTILAYHLANLGKRVLLLDFDLESPGLSSLVLPPEGRADFGLVDWFIEDGVGQGAVIAPRLVAASPLGQTTQGAIRVVAAMGQETGDDHYVSKLARVYADVNRNGGVERFADRVRRLVGELEAQEQPDVVLIDSRAGLHDLAAIGIVGLSTTAYLFAAGSAQSWQGYRLLFSHWRAYPEVLARIRDRLVMVHALFPEIDQLASADRFLEESYTLFTDTLYERIAPGAEIQAEVFNFDLKDEAAPHYPVRIRWHNSLQEFDPLLRSRHILDDALIAATFGDFLKRVEADLGGTQDG